MKNRYPGTQPFTAEQKDLFYGRKQETDDMMKLIRFQQMVVLYGKSGLGKSSLLNASIKPKVEASNIAEVFAVRFNAWTEGADTPLSKTADELLTFRRFQTFERLNPLASIADGTLWYAAKVRQLATKKQRFLLVFDQFEELFTYPDAVIQEFKESLTELMRAGLPKRIEENIKNLDLSDDDLDTLYETADIKVLFAIRSDRMHLLDKLSDVLPDILRHCYELKALVEADAREAVVKPAAMSGDFDVPAFNYTEGALSDIVSFLKDEDGRVEAIQLQTLCQAFERTIKTNGQSITAADTPTEKLKDIIDHYYKTQIDDPRVTDKLTAHRLIEDELVIETGDNKGVRVTLHELSILVKFAQKDKNEADERYRLKHLLDALVNVHLLRREVGSRGGDTYELSHDRLIEPVLKSKKVYLEEKRVREEAEERNRKETELAEAKRQAEIEKQRAEEAEKLKNAALSAQKRAQFALVVASILLVLAVAGLWYARQQQQKAQDSLTKMLKAQKERQTTEAEKLIQQAEVDIKAEQYHFAKQKLDSAKTLVGNSGQIDSLLKQIPNSSQQ